MGRYAWIITKDHIDSGRAVGTVGPSGADELFVTCLKKGMGKPFRMYDGDGELYYEGLLETDDPFGESLFGPLDDFGEPNAGAVEIRYEFGGEWKTV